VDGLFHPNCQHTINAIDPELARETYGWNAFTGQYEKGVLSSGDHKLDLVNNQGGWIQVYQGKGAEKLMSQNIDMLGQAQYFSRKNTTAKLFGKTSKLRLDDKHAKIMTIASDQEYDDFTKKVLRKYTGEDLMTSIPKYAKANKIDAIEISQSYDPLGGIAVFNDKIIK
jgi:hypothetical protein